MRIYYLLFILLSSFASMAQPVGANMSNPIIMGTYGGGTYSYSDMKNNDPANGYGDDIGQGSDDIYYQFIVQGSTNITISTCSTNFDTYLHLLDASGNEITSNDDAWDNCPSNNFASYINTTLAAGTYYIVTEGYGTNSGDLYLSVSLAVQGAPLGANMSNPIIMGTYGAGTFSYSDMKNNSTANSYGNDIGQGSDDIYYKFILQGSTNVIISTCPSSFDTYLHLLDVNGNEIAYNDDAGSNCSYSLTSYISTTLAAGTYYIVTEGYGTNSGDIYLSVNLTTQSPPVTDTRNFLKTWTANAPETDPNNLETRPLRDVKYSVTYFDGLGRPSQSVIKQGSLITSTDVRADVVTPFEYDQFDREIKKYMPYVASTSDGLYKTTATADQLSFNQSFFSAQGENTFYSQTDYETSPLNMVAKQMSPGASWAGSGRGVQTSNWLNTTTDAVRIWNVTDVTNDFGTYASTATYAPGTLYKTITSDEQGNQLIEFNDLNGKTILKKVQLTAAIDDGTTGSGHAGWLCTYYIYDDLDEVRAIIQPKGVDAMNSSGNWTLDASNNTTILNELTFRYEYDTRGRMIMKQVVGAGAVQMVYDQRDRLVMMQDANLRTNQQWLVTTYDNFNRPVSTYKITDPSSATSGINAANASNHRSNAYNNTSYPTVSGYANEWLMEDHYDDYSNLPSGLSSSFSASNYSTYLNASNASPEYGETVPASPSALTKGMVTWSRLKVLGTTNQFNTAVNLYDDKGRIVQVQSINITGGLDVLTKQYSFSAQVLRTHVKHQKLTGTVQIYEVATKNTFDDLGRMALVEKNVAGSGYKQISSLQYDVQGHLKTKKLAPYYNSSAGLETLNFDYNIRGWLLGVNRTDLANNGSGSSKFAFELGYDKLTNSSGRNFSSLVQYNGNITGMIWKSAGDGIRRKYDFSYDAVNRLMKGVFEQNNNDATWNNSQMDYTVKMGDGSTPSSAYDANGNIKAMTQYGWKMGQAATSPVDNLTYNYQINGTGDDLRNKLQRVTDAANDPNSKLGDFKDGTNSGDDYSYDPNGNLTVDNNKSISSITYNYLNLPETVTVTGKGTISYVYDASGNKLKKIVSETGQPTKTTLYLFGTYENDVLQFLPQEEGRIRLRTSDNTWQYDYFLKDHMGNTRMVLTDEQEIDPYETLTFEDANITEQNVYWENKNGQPINVSSVRTSVNFGGTTTNAMLVRQSSSNGTIGATKLLKVMAGDRIHTKLDYYFATANNTNNSSTTTLTNIVSSIVSSITNSSSPGNLIKGGEATVSSQLNANSIFSGFVNPIPNNNPNNGTPLPKAYLCVLFFDEQFQFDQANSRAYPISYSSNGAGTIDRTFSNAIQAGKNGYAYIYFTNESNELVYFDNFYLSHERGPITEETHYYPFGLTMAGISSKALKGTSYPENKYKFNDGTELQNNEFSDGSGLELYETDFRSYDPQIGRFHQMDPLADFSENWSPYSFVMNNPLLYNDPWGLDTVKAVVKPPSDAKPGQKIDVTNSGGGKSSYIYDPTNPEADNTGMVSNGMVDPTLKEVVVTPSSANKSNDDEDDDDNTSKPTPAPTPAPKPPSPAPAAAPAQKPEPQKPSLLPAAHASKTTYYDRALTYPDAKYVSGGMAPKAYDCTGLVCLVTGAKDHWWATAVMKPPPGHWQRIYPSNSSYNKFLNDLNKGDLLVWRKGGHAAFYSGDGRLFGAHKPLKNSGFGSPGELKSYWIEQRGYPEEVYREND